MLDMERTPRQGYRIVPPLFNAVLHVLPVAVMRFSADADDMEIKAHLPRRKEEV